MKKISELTPQDFAGLSLDDNQFNNWKTEKVKAEKNVKIFALVTLIILVIALLTSQHFVAPGALIIILIMFIMRNKSNKMAKAMGLNERKILDARKGKFKA